MPGAAPVSRCRWVNEHNPLYVNYHDTEWGVPCREDAYLYEMLVLESFVAGLSWECVLNKRVAFRAAFADFQVEKVAQFAEKEVDALMQNTGIIRHRGKIKAAITNSRVFLHIQAEFGSFAAYVAAFVGAPSLYEPYHERVSSPVSDAISRDLKRRGMRFVGSVTIYSWMQAVGLIQAHGPECYLHAMGQGNAR